MEEEDFDDLDLGAIRRIGTRAKRVSFAPGVASGSGEAPPPTTGVAARGAAETRVLQLEDTLKAVLENQNKLLERMTSGPPRGGDPATSLLLGGKDDAGLLRGGQDREDFERKLDTEEGSAEISRIWWEEVRRERGVEDGDPFHAARYGEITYGHVWDDHSTLKRTWLMLSAIHRRLMRGQVNQALGQTVQNLKATGFALTNRGKWAGAWEHTYLPELGSRQSGVTSSENAALGRHLREKAAVAKALEEATKKKEDA